MRKIDAMVAERVMGWVWCDRLCGWCPDRKDATLSDIRSKQEWKPSTDIGAAWEVAEKIRERKDKNGGSVMCHVIDRVTEWHCDITSDDLRIDVLGAGDTAPLAICLAALRAVGVDEAEIQEAMR